MPQQFSNPANPTAHRLTTASEILRQLPSVDALVAGVGTGGTITGVGEVLRARHPDLQIFAVEPASSPILSGGEAGYHNIQGIGAGFVPEVLNTAVYDEVLPVTDEEATLYASHSLWESKAAFEAWTESESFRKAHASARAPRGTYLDHPRFEGFEVLL